MNRFERINLIAKLHKAHDGHPDTLRYISSLSDERLREEWRKVSNENKEEISYKKLINNI